MKTLKLLIIWMLFFTVQNLSAEELKFNDNNGKIVDQGDNYKIRLIESEDSGVKTAEAVFLIKAPPQAVFKAVTDFKHYPEFMPNIKAASLVEKTGDGSKYRFTLKVAFLDIDYTLLLKSSIKNEIYRLAWTYVEGDIRDTSGSWEIKHYDKNNEYSLVFYRVKTDPGRFMPDWAADRLSTRSIPDMIRAVRKKVK